MVELQVRVVEPPFATVVGLAATVAVGTTLMVTVATLLVPLAPEHVREKLVAAFMAPELCVPLVASVPDQPPEAVHDVAFVDDQVSVVDCPPATAGWAALMEAVGAADESPALPESLEPPEPPPQAARRTVARRQPRSVESRMVLRFVVLRVRMECWCQPRISMTCMLKIP